MKGGIPLLSGKVIIVTGGAKGIGLGCAQVMARKGATIVIADIDEKGGLEAEARLQELRAKALFVATDVSKRESVERMVGVAVAEYGRLDCMLNNAGTHISKTIFDQTEEEWDRLIDINLKGYFLCTKAALPHLVEAKGNIVNMSSMVGVVGQSRAAAYAASKGGIVAMTKALALDLAPHGVRVNCICPGWVTTPLVEEWFNQQPDPEEARRHIYSVHPLGRIATVEEVGEAAAFLASEAASFITGIALPVDGAVTLGY